MEFNFAKAIPSLTRPGFLQISGNLIGAPLTFEMPIGKALEMAGQIETEIQKIAEAAGDDESRSTAVA